MADAFASAFFFMTSEDLNTLPYRPCVGIVLANKTGAIFVGQRNDNFKDAWQMPQGGIDAGEDARQAALRELWEETGVTADLVEFVAETPDWLTYELPDELLGKIWKGKYRGQKQIWFLLRFTGRDDQINIATEHPEFSAWQWMKAADVVDNIVPFKRDVYAKVIDLFSDKL